MNGTTGIGNVQPAAGDTLIFPEGAAGAAVNDFPADTKFAAITVAEGYTISGNRIQLTDSLTVPDAGNQQALIVRQHPAEGAGHRHRTVTLTAAANTRLLVTGVISGNDTVVLRKEGPGLVIDERHPMGTPARRRWRPEASRSSRSERSDSPAKARRCCPEPR